MTKTLRPVFPNCGIEKLYRKRLLLLVQEMAVSYRYWICAAWRSDKPVLAQDASPAVELDKALKALFRYWSKRYREMAPKLARYFATAASKRSDAVLSKILRDGGISIKFQMTRPMQDVLAATVAENVALIKSIPEQFHLGVQGSVMRSVQTGRDLHQLTKDLQKSYRVTRKRAELIARDQNNKATSTLVRVRQEELGVKKAVWLHSHAGKEPRPTHLANHGEQYDVAEGWFDPDPKVRQRIWPGQLINCRCVSKSVVKGFS
jgi:SPP1 gp7 family putative phage head morphogenesis protein